MNLNRKVATVKYACLLITCLTLILPQINCKGQEETAEGPYTFREGSLFGTGKWYMGREIAEVMGYQGMRWLEREDREEEERTSRLLRNMEIEAGDTIADIGAGSGYHVFKMAPRAEPGLVYAVDIQEKMLAELRRKKKENKQENVRVVQGGIQGANLPESSVDKVLMVDVYHEFSHPVEMLASIRKALRPGGTVYLIEYRGEDPSVPIKELHKMTEAQAVREMQAAGFELLKNYDNLPWQHCMVFVLDGE